MTSRFVAAALVVSSFLSGSARAETLATSAVAPRGTSPDSVPVRSDRVFAVLGETGWNSLAGTGVVGVFNLAPHLSLDTGAGLGFEGFKLGARARYNFFTSELTPFLGAGFIWASGLKGLKVDSGASNSPELNVAPSSFVQVVGGLDWTTRRGFELLFNVGYARLLSSNNNTYVAGRDPTPEERANWKASTGSGLVASIALGRAF